ncbi:class D sortase [Metabacillus fastidiosus]|uniref:class D sortase n=1 Tax=Metabacillus fastidiosus TaxID=1458 RepID=UPI003D27BEFB
MARSLGIVAVFLIIGGISYSAWHMYSWWDGKQSVQTIGQMEENSVVSAKSLNSEDIFSESTYKPTIEDYSTLEINYETGQKVAKLEIPALNQVFDIFWNTDDFTLKKGVGMYVSEWTTTPNETGGHTVVSGHRDTVFTELGDLKNDDEIYIHYENKTYKYSIQKIWITHAEDRTVIVKKDIPTLTLTTCYPFDYIGSAPDRYIIQGELVSEK